MNSRTVLLIIHLLFIAVFAVAQSPIGTWRTIDDNTGEPRSHVTIYQNKGKLFGKIAKLLDEDPKTYCMECPGKKANQPLIGLVIVEDMDRKGDVWSKGTIMDPENGNIYRCKIWLAENDPNQLKVRGIHWTGLYRTQTWWRVTD